MVLSILIATITAPGLLGSQEAIRQSQSKEKREEHRARRCNLIATCVKSSNRSREINGRQVVLRNGKLWIDTGTEDGSPLGHPYAGYYLPYPDTKYEGLVTTITDVAPIMNWVYIDKETCEVKYGVRADAQPNLTGPFDCTRQDRRLTFDGWEGWCAVEQAPGLWELYFDLNDDGLKSKLGPGTRVLEIELSRKEKRFQKETNARQQDQTTTRAVDTKEEAPTDQPLAPEPLVSNPGVSDEKASEAGAQESYKYRPMKIPKSIFENPPPMIESLVFRAPTPPPAYTPATKEEPENAAETKKPESVESEEPIAGPAITVQDTNVPDVDDQQVTGQSISEPEQPRLTPDNTVQAPLIETESSPPASQSPPTKESRTTPKLNRNSGSRALAQALKFEAMAAAQNSKDQLRERSNERRSRVNSNTSSMYSDDDEVLEDPVAANVRPQPSPTPAPLALAVSKTKQAMALAMRPQQPGVAKPAPNPSIERPITPPRQRARSVREDPAVSGSMRASSSQRLAVSRTSQSSQSSAKRPTSQSSNQRPPSARQQRERSSSEQPVLARPSSRPTVQSSPGPGRQSLARTMTTGKGNQGMSNRIGGGYVSRERNMSSSGRQIAPPVAANRSRSATVGRKTTSALFREIDDLVNQEDKGSASTNTRGRDERRK
ncbi:hypothetical protein COCC4DRAFT_133280 [Bipolaris maydis ATCC 48331]|uniref:Uncharacterized protein n=2 Tax=Cochliobolus heterostrophus TaxID=5016 RepID=M2T7J5_COCH5|nr:uncharacterized protein COCC4DRAFT_133280 [Bipolaris maydis ATCC 48331]EMD93555.1 hypothetical protein COCHEDRAFT_1202458 [Bipolaris maydis C5]KAH7562470.1 hypothetical protein BM1_01990 [Bipolaris maydis]ENI06996.1 hypothetical protein COCC4DRAFT_133280 [Bipolaris maydis ATCC 48331]KAJ5027867.1 hypothetical protein J3E73DRAFT_422367 [Bipolaris maydis]KAJ6198898.1 hypothetical protein J3E72DRAFT_239306 [Bipolaris maydis]